MANDLRADLDELFLQARQRPILDRLWRRQRAQKITKIVGQRMKLKSNRVGGEGPTREPCPLDRALALLDPLLACPALVLEHGKPFCVIRDDQPDARKGQAGRSFIHEVWPIWVPANMRGFMRTRVNGPH